MDPENFRYNFNHKKRGRAIIIVNGDFNEYFDDLVWRNGRLVQEETGLEKRRGALTEMKLMKKFFRTLGFNTKCYRDVTAKQMKAILRQAADIENKKFKQKQEVDCFACIICSHGMQGEPEPEEPSSDIANRRHGVAGIDGYFVLTKDIIGFFEESKCPALKNKPKLFFFQACRSNVDATSVFEKFDISVKVKVTGENPGDISTPSDLVDNQNTKDRPKLIDIPEDQISDADTDSENDDPDYDMDLDEVAKTTDISGVQRVQTRGGDYVDTLPSTDKESLVSEDIAVVASVPCYTDMLLMFASPEGKFAFRSDFLGGWLVQYLYETLETYDMKRMDLLTFLNMVTFETVQKRAFKPPPPEDENDSHGKLMMKYFGSKVTPVIIHRLRGDVYFNDSKLRTRKSILSKLKDLVT